MKCIGQGDDRHALMMRHIAADDRHLLVLGQPRRGIVKSFIPAIPPVSARGLEGCEVSYRCLGRNHRRQGSGVRSDDDIIGKGTLEPETGNAKA